MHSISRTQFVLLAKVLTLGLLLGLSVQILHAWTAPGAAAPGGNVSGPITAGLFTTYQIRNAGLGLTGSLNVSNVGAQNNKVTAPKICLNNDGSETNCITAWPSGGGGSVLAGCYAPAQTSTSWINGTCVDSFASGSGTCWGGATGVYERPLTGNTTAYGKCPDGTIKYGTVTQTDIPDQPSSCTGSFVCVGTSASSPTPSGVRLFTFEATCDSSNVGEKAIGLACNRSVGSEMVVGFGGQPVGCSMIDANGSGLMVSPSRLAECTCRKSLSPIPRYLWFNGGPEWGDRNACI